MPHNRLKQRKKYNPPYNTDPQNNTLTHHEHNNQTLSSHTLQSTQYTHSSTTQRTYHHTHTLNHHIAITYERTSSTNTLTHYTIQPNTIHALTHHTPFTQNTRQTTSNILIHHITHSSGTDTYLPHTTFPYHEIHSPSAHENTQQTTVSRPRNKASHTQHITHKSHSSLYVFTSHSSLSIPQTTLTLPSTHLLTYQHTHLTRTRYTKYLP